jgi:hypothetical protein
MDAHAATLLHVAWLVIKTACMHACMHARDRKVAIKNNQLGIKLIPMISTLDKVDPT